MKPWIASAAVIGAMIVLTYLSCSVRGVTSMRKASHKSNRNSHDQNEHLLTKARAFLLRSKQTKSHVASMLHAARARVLCAAVNPKTSESERLCEECALRESAAVTVVKRVLARREEQEQTRAPRR